MGAQTGSPAPRRSLRRTAGATCLAAAIAAVLNTLLAVGAAAVFGTPAAFEPFAISAVVIASVVGALGAGACFAVLNRFARRPVPLFLGVTGAVLVASMYPPIALALAEPPPYPGTGIGPVVALMLMHVLVALVSVWLLVPDLRVRPSRVAIR